MKRIILLLIAFFSLPVIVSSQWELRDTVEFQQRNGLPNFFNKIDKNEIIKVGFLGGSITEAKGWRLKIESWLKEYYQIDSIICFNAAIGGTNSMYGVFRIDRHLLSKFDFDLIFIEFAANDGNGIAVNVERSMEGIVRKIRKSNPLTDICFVYTVTSNFLLDVENGKMNLSASKHDSIASYYDIPTIFWGCEVYNQLQSDSVVWTDEITNNTTSQNNIGQYVFTKDNIHPTNFGHQVYTDVLSESFIKMDTFSVLYNHDPKTSIVEDNYEDAKMLAGNILNNHGMTVIDKIDQMDYLDEFIDEDTWFLVADDTSSYYSCSFIGSLFGLNMIIGPTGGRYIIEIDGVKWEDEAFDGYCSYWRKDPKFIHLEDNVEHFVKVYLSPNKLTLAEKREILNSDDRKIDLDNNPSKYAKNELIFSDIFIVGELTNNYTESASICSGDSLNWQGQWYKESGQYNAAYQMTNGFDSIYQLNLTTYPTYYIEYFDTINTGDSLLWQDEYFKEEGSYYVNHQTIIGCDSILKLNLHNNLYQSNSLHTTKESITIFPNPASKVVFIKNAVPSGNNTIVTIYDLYGREILRNQINSKSYTYPIDIHDYDPGIYLLSIKNDVTFDSKIFIKY